MVFADFAFPVRAGEHACCRSDDARDRERLLMAFVHAGLERGHKVVRLCEGGESDKGLARLLADPAVHAAAGAGRFEAREAADVYEAAGGFDAGAMLARLRDEHRRALDEGFAGLSVCGDVGAGLRGIARERLVEYERRLDAELGDGTWLLLCQYDDPSFDERVLEEVTCAHHVVVSPGLAAIGRSGVLAAARVTPPDTLRMAGELDFQAADDVARVLEAEFPGPRRVDAADLEFVDVAGMRALRGTPAEPLVLAAASDAVRRLVGLLGWDTDPAVEVTA
jgi:ABC-type transporter Mla MlaB component